MVSKSREPVQSDISYAMELVYTAGHYMLYTEDVALNKIVCCTCLVDTISHSSFNVYKAVLGTFILVLVLDWCLRQGKRWTLNLMKVVKLYHQ